MIPAETPQIGLLLPSREVVCWGNSDLYRVVEAATNAEQVGYDSVWVGDSLLARPRGEPFTLLSAVAAVTERVALGTAVLLPLLRHPLTLAHLASSLDRISRGRLILAVGPGATGQPTRDELVAIGIETDQRVSAMLESVARCRRLWRGDDANLRMLPEPHRRGGPPLWLGANGPRLLRRTGEEFDGWLPLSGSPAEYAERLEMVRNAARMAGRDPDVLVAGVYLTVAISESAAQSQADLDAYMHGYYGLPVEVMSRVQACHAGTEDTAADWICEYASAGARHIVVRLARPTLDGYEDSAADLLSSVRRALD